MTTKWLLRCLLRHNVLVLAEKKVFNLSNVILNLKKKMLIRKKVF